MSAEKDYKPCCSSNTSTKTYKLITNEGEEVECECICKCIGSSKICKCDCKCSHETAKKTADGKYVCECTCKCSSEAAQSCCTKTGDDSCILTKACKLTTSDGKEVDCECICRCAGSCDNCECDCKCTPETAKKTSDGKYVCECTCKYSSEAPQSCCTKTGDDSCILTKACKLTTSDGKEVDCECICRCTGSCDNCDCDCKCTPETAKKTSDGKYVCECTCKCSSDTAQSCCTKTGDDSCILTKACKLTASDGNEVDCECICRCTGSCDNCECDCKCAPETANKTTDGKYVCECTCKCSSETAQSCCTKTADDICVLPKPCN